jgi:glycosyltransferase involved in cell wall biosynthesis
MVVLLVNKFFFEKGGSERYFFMQSDALAARGHDVVHFSMNHPDNRPSPWSSRFVKQRDYYDVSGVGISPRDVTGFIRSGEAARAMTRLVEETAPDVAHLHNIYHQLTPSIIPVLRRHRIPVVMTLHDYKLVCPNYRMFAHGRYCERCLGGKFYRAPLTRCNDGSLARSTLLALEAYVQALSGVYDHVYRFLAPSEYMRETFIRAGFDPAARRRDVAFVLCGDGPERARLERRAQEAGMDHVVFTGHLEKSVLDGVVRGAVAAVLPAEWPENAPFGVLEAAMQGVPVIVSDMGGLPEMARIARGRVFRHGDAASLGEAIDEVLADPGARAGAEAGRRAVEEHYDRDRHLEALESIYAAAREAQ